MLSIVIHDIHSLPVQNKFSLLTWIENVHNITFVTYSANECRSVFYSP